MRAKHFFKQLLTTLDQALLRDILARKPQPTAVLQAPPASEPPPATDDPGADTVALTDTRMLVALDVSGEIYTILHPTYQLIDAPHSIAAPLLQPFLDGSKEVTLVFAQNGKTLPATLQSAYSTYLVADTELSTFRHQRGETVLVTFRVAPQQHYVLQTVIDKLYAFRLKLRYGDPRYDVRRRVQLAAPVTLSLAPTALVTDIAQRQVRIMREITLPLRGAQSTAGGRIADQLCEPITLQPTSSPFAATPALSCTLEDISLGGVCLALANDAWSEELLHRLVLLNIALPNAPEALYPSLTLQLLGGIRGVRSASSVQLLHIRFLKRLPKEVDELLEHLEGSAVKA